LFFGIELAGGVEQTQDPRMHQIVEIHMHRQILVNAHRNRFYER